MLMFRSHALHRILSLAIAFMFASLQVAYPLPTDPTVENGTADIKVNGSTMTINASDRAVINYSSFNIAANESVVITLPNVSSSILNRDLGGNMSTLAGMLQCNGLFILVNSAGIYVAPTAKIDVGSIVLSTRDINTQDYINSNLVFRKISKDQLDALLLNAGTINISKGGFGVLIAGAVENQGTIVAPIGKVHLASGDAVRLEMSGDGLISVAIEEKVASTIYDHQGRPITDAIKNSGILGSGVVVLSAESVTGVFTKAVNLEGHVNADSFTVRADGTVRLTADVVAEKSVYDAPKTELVGTDPYYFHGDVTIYNFEATTPGREIYFEAGRSYTFPGILTLRGAYAEHIRLLSSEQGVRWNIDPQGARDISYTWVEDSCNLSPDKIMMVESTNRGNCVNWDPTAYWTGAVNDLWSNAGNWSGLGGGMLPGAGDTVVFDNTHGSGRLTSVVDTYDYYIDAMLFDTFDVWLGTSITFQRNLTAANGNIINHTVPVIIGGSGAITIENVKAGGSVELANWGSTITLNNGADFLVKTANGTIGLGNVHGTGGRDLTANAGTGNVFIGSVGGVGDDINAVSLTGTETHLYNDILTGTLAGSSFTATGTTYLENGVTIDTRASNGDVSLGVVRGVGTDKDLTVRAGGNAFIGTVGSGNEVNDVYITGGEIHLYGDITTSNAVGNKVRLVGAVKLEADVTMNTDTAGTDGPITITGAVDGAHTLALRSGTQAISVTQAIGSGTPLSAIDFAGTTIGVKAVTTSGAQSYNGITTVAGNISGGSMTIGGTMNAGASNFTVGGSWANSGTFNAGTSTVEFNGAGVSTISGNDSNFKNLKCVTAGKELDFASGTTQTVTGALTLTGAAGNYVKLRRSGGAGLDQWIINPTGTAGVSYVDLQNSNNAAALITARSSLDSGNNTNWAIIAPSPVVPPAQGGGGNLTDSSTFERDTSPGFSNPGPSLMTTMYSPDLVRQAIITMAAMHVNAGEQGRPKE